MKKRGLLILTTILAGALSLQAQDIILEDTTITDVSCGGYTDGSITIEVSGGNGNLSYTLLRGSPIATTGFIPDRTYTFNGLEKASNYAIYVADATAEDIFVSSLEVGGPDTITIDSYDAADITCNNDNDGVITVTASGESGTFDFTLSGPFNDVKNTGTFTGLPAGDYTVEVTDGTGTCTSSDITPTLTITNPAPVSITLDDVQDATCYQGSDGSIDITPGGGTPSGTGTGYTYSWTGPGGFTATSEDIAGLEAGDYTVTVYDANLCESTLGPITVGEAPQITVSVNSVTDVTCNGGTDGSVSITPGGGTPGYTYNWTGQNTAYNSTSQNPSNLPADTYDLVITDSQGCSRTFPGLITVNEPQPITVTVDDITDVRCFGESTGEAQITVSGGTAPYTFTWSGPSGYSSTQQNPTAMPAGSYSLLVTDAEGCMQNFTGLLTVDEPTDITATVDNTTDVTCFGGSDGTAEVTVNGGTPGYTYLWTGDLSGYTGNDEDPADLVADSYTLEVTDANSCVKTFDDLVTIGEPAQLDVTVDNITDVLCNGDATGAIDITPSGGTAPYVAAWTGPGGFTAGDEDITGLEAGDYSVTITDAAGCSRLFTDVATVDENTTITAAFTVNDLTCNGAGDGAIDATVNGGVPPYTYSWTGTSGFTAGTEDIGSLDPDDYTLTVTDDVGCVQSFPAQTVTEPDPISVTFTPANATCNGADNGSIDIDVTGGTPAYSFAWSGPGGFSETTEDVSGLAPGDYSLTVTDANGCSVDYIDQVTITEPDPLAYTVTSVNISCAGYDDGSIDITVTGGTPPYSYDWSGPGGFTSTEEDPAGLAPGSYSVTVTDANTCSQTFPGVATLTEPTPINATLVTQNDLLCNGESDGSVEIDVSGGVTPLAFTWTNSAGTVVSTDEDPTGLPADTYSLQIIDDNGCIADYPDFVILAEPTELTSTLDKTDIICAGDANGTITVNASGGTPPYEYSQFGETGPYVPDADFTGLTAAEYTIWTRDANGCTTSATTTIVEPKEIKIGSEEWSGDNILCHGDANGEITISGVTGGVSPYEYSIDGGATYQPSGEFTGLTGGTYPIVVRDANGCEKPSSTLQIDEPSAIEISYYYQDDVTTCFDAGDGRIIINGSGGTTPYTYVLDDTVTTTNGDFQDIIGGPHDLSIVDDNGCTKDTSVVIDRPAELVIDDVTLSDITTCPGDNTGSIELTVSGGTGSYSYSDNGIDFQPSNRFENLTAGDYTITVMDDNGCTKDTTVTLTEPDPVTVNVESTTPASCAGTPDGSLEVSATGGTAPYSFTLQPGGTSNGTGTFNNLAAGDYTVEVTDANMCGPVVTGTITVDEPDAIVVDSVQTQIISCNGANDAEIHVYVSGGSPPYEYTLDGWSSPPLSFSHFTGLTPGTYDVWVRDANGCERFIDTYIFDEPDPIVLNVTTTDVSPCFGNANGEISATATGGSGSFEYSIDAFTFQPSGDFTGLDGGEYTVYARDGGGCNATETVTINEPEEITATIEKTDYVDETLGTITITNPAGGTPPLEFSVNGMAGPFTSTTSYTDLTAGDYDVVIRDANGCTYEETVTIYDIVPLPMTINSTDVTCYGADDGTIEFVPQDAVGEVQYSIDDGNTYVTTALFENLPGDSTYLLRAYDEEDKQYSGTVFIDEPDELMIYKNIVPANCNSFSETGSIDVTTAGGTGGHTFAWADGSTTEDRNDIVSGWYALEVTDEAGCVTTDSIYVPADVIVNALAGEDTTICQGESVQLDAQGGEIVSWQPATYLTDTSISNPVAEQVMESVTYAYRVSETASPYGCYDVDSLTITVLPVTGLEVTPDTFAVKGQSIQLEAIGSFVSFRWTPDQWLDNDTTATPVTTPQNSITYYVNATNSNGCVETDSVFIEVIENITVYNAFSPNGDGQNEYFEIEGASQFPGMLVEVYNRWGDKLFSSRGYSDDKRWDGTSNGKDVPIGTYYYVIIPYPDAKPITGNVTIIR